jgi:hypothetical protein
LLEKTLKPLKLKKPLQDEVWKALTERDPKAKEMFDLMDKFFPSFRDEIKENKNATVRGQIGVLRLNQAALTGQMELSQPHTSTLEQIKKDHRFDMEHRSLEHSLVTELFRKMRHGSQKCSSNNERTSFGGIQERLNPKRFGSEYPPFLRLWGRIFSRRFLTETTNAQSD